MILMIGRKNLIPFLALVLTHAFSGPAEAGVNKGFRFDFSVKQALLPAASPRMTMSPSLQLLPRNLSLLSVPEPKKPTSFGMLSSQETHNFVSASIDKNQSSESSADLSRRVFEGQVLRSRGAAEMARANKAMDVLGRSITLGAAGAIMEAHYLGKGPKYTKEEIAAKARILRREGGFSMGRDGEIRKLMKNNIVGVEDVDPIDPPTGLVLGDATGRDLYGMIKDLSTGVERNEAIGKIPYSAWKKMESEDIWSILSLAGERGGVALYDKVPKMVWDRMWSDHVEPLVIKLTARGSHGMAEFVVRHWMVSQWRTRYYDVVKQMRASRQRDAIILKIVSGQGGQMKSDDLAAVLSLIVEGNKARGYVEAAYDQIPKRAWKGLRHKDLTKLTRWCTAAGYKSAATIIIKHWMSANIFSK